MSSSGPRLHLETRKLCFDRHRIDCHGNLVVVGQSRKCRERVARRRRGEYARRGPCGISAATSGDAAATAPAKPTRVHRVKRRSPDVRAQFQASNDYWEFAERIHDAAKRGDGAAQYYLGVALNTCELLYRYYFMEPRAGALRAFARSMKRSN